MNMLSLFSPAEECITFQSVLHVTITENIVNLQGCSCDDSLVLRRLCSLQLLYFISICNMQNEGWCLVERIHLIFV
jgi:hypothetical protein